MPKAADVVARVLAVGGAFTLIASIFLPWSGRGVAPLEVRVGDWASGAQPTLAVVVIAAVAIPAVGALVSASPLPRAFAAAAGAALTLWWLASGPAAELTTGVWTSLAGCVVMLLSAGLAPPNHHADTSRRPANARPSVTSSA